MLHELGIGMGTYIFVMVTLYFVIKAAVRNGAQEAYSAITGKKTHEEEEYEEMMQEAREKQNEKAKN